jgi:hypothetical protein
MIGPKNDRYYNCKFWRLAFGVQVEFAGTTGVQKTLVQQVENRKTIGISIASTNYLLAQ